MCFGNTLAGGPIRGVAVVLFCELCACSVASFLHVDSGFVCRSLR